jgi:hypothetical protein
VREIRTLRATGRGLETEPWRGLRHRQKAKAAGNSYSPLPVATAPALDPTGTRTPRRAFAVPGPAVQPRACRRRPSTTSPSKALSIAPSRALRAPTVEQPQPAGSSDASLATGACAVVRVAPPPAGGVVPVLPPVAAGPSPVAVVCPPVLVVVSPPDAPPVPRVLGAPPVSGVAVGVWQLSPSQNSLAPKSRAAPSGTALPS